MPAEAPQSAPESVSEGSAAPAAAAGAGPAASPAGSASSRAGAVRRLSVVIPVYNSQDTILRLVDEVLGTLEPHFEHVELVLVNDGSRDASHERLCEVAQARPDQVKYVRLARNFGEHNAVMCGLHQVTGDAVAIMDDDLQNPPAEVVRMVEALVEGGHDVVYSYYAEKKHHWFRNLGSRFNDRVATFMLGKPHDLYLSSFKVMNAFLARAVTSYVGPFPYLDGLVLRSTSSIGRLEVRHESRAEGQSNYTLIKLLRLWLNMFTGFSIFPLRVASLLGLSMALTSMLMLVFFVASWVVGGILFEQPIPPGWASLIVSITLFSGVQLCVLGVVGEYLGRLFLTQNNAPQFVVREVRGRGSDHDVGEERG
jgi:glycosyltransferase involved in cell wall biosynthesis